MVSVVEETIERAAEHLRECRLCPRECRVNRAAGERGYCRLDDNVHCFREMLHRAEEADLSPSHQVYFAGCNLGCEFCSVAEWNEQPLTAGETSLDWIVGRIEQRQQQGARNVNLLGGEPIVSLPGILRLLGRLRTHTPVVLNSNMYYNVCVDALLRGWVDIYLADLKCGSERCAEALLGARDYVHVARRNLLVAAERARVIVRHLILPGHAECCLRPTLRWLAQEMPGVEVSLRTDYVPPATAVSAPQGYMTGQDIAVATDCARDLGLHLVN